MLPCNVIIQEDNDDVVHVAVVDPMASMQAVDNAVLQEVAQEVHTRLDRVVKSL